MAMCEDRVSCIYALLWVGLIWFIIIPFEIYATINIIQYRYHLGVQTRYPMVLVISAIFAMLHSFICEQFYYLSSGVNIDILHNPSVSYTVTLIFPPLFLIMMIIIIYRIYLLHYSINYAVVQSARNWQSLLSATVSSKDFYSQHHATYGHWKYVSRYFIAYGVIGSLTEICITLCENPNLFGISHSISQLVYVFWNVNLLIFGACLFLKTPRFEDIYFVRNEMSYFVYFACFCLGIYVAMMPLISDDYRIFEQISTSAITLFNFGGVVISEIIMLRNIKCTDENGFDINMFETQRSRAGTSLSLQLQPKNCASSRQLFNALIASSVCINYFVKHLQSEFSSENFLCFIEIIQWLYNATDGEFVMFDTKPFTGIDFELSSSIPISSANQRNDNGEWKWEESILIIFKKYIHSSAEYQVNLPYGVQSAFINLIHLLSIKQQTANGTYTFKHKPKEQSSKNRVQFQSDIRKRKQSLNLMTISDCNELNDNNSNVNTLPLSDSSTTAVSASYNAFMKMFRKNAEKKLFPNISAPNPITKEQIDDGGKKTQSFKSLHDVQEKKLINETYINRTASDTIVESESRSSSEDNNELKVVDELVVLDDAYLNGDTYADPELGDFNASFISSTKMSDILIRDQIKKKELNNLHLKPKALSLNIAHSLRKSLRKFSWIISKSKSVNEYMTELLMIEEAKKLTVIEFVSLSCSVLEIILQLNYQSVRRFKMSLKYKNMLGAVDMEQLINKYGEKGVLWS